MASIFNYLYKCIAPILPQMKKEQDLLQEFPHLDAKQWQSCLNRKVNPIPVPEELRAMLNLPCPYTPNKLIKETFIACLVPDHITVNEIRSALGHSPHPYSNRLSVPEKSYWILIKKTPIPNTTRMTSEKQYEILNKENFLPPLAIEAVIATVAAKFLGKVSLFSNEANRTRCAEEVDERPLNVGSDLFTDFTVSRDIYLQNGVAGVRRF